MRKLANIALSNVMVRMRESPYSVSLISDMLLLGKVSKDVSYIQPTQARHYLLLLKVTSIDVRRAHGVVGYHARLASGVCERCWVQFPMCPFFFFCPEPCQVVTLSFISVLKSWSR